MGKSKKHAVKKTNVPTLDLHGERIDGLVDKVDRFLMDAHRNGLHQIQIMTGKGSGQVRKTVQDYLKLGGYTYRYAVLPSGEQNDGILIVQV